MANPHPKHKFKKGHPGGPGRPKGGNLEWCREFADSEGKERLMKLARCSDEKVSLQALTLIFAYGHGKPTEHSNVTHEVKDLPGLLKEFCAVES